VSSQSESTRQASARRVLDQFKDDQPSLFEDMAVRQRVHDCCQAATMQDLTRPVGDVLTIKLGMPIGGK